MEKYLRVNLLGPGPRLMKKIIYWAAVSQRLRNTELEGLTNKDIQWWSNKWLIGTTKVHCRLNIHTNMWEVSLSGFPSERWLVTNVIERAIVTGGFLICLYSPQVRQTATPQPKMTFDLSCQISKLIHHICPIWPQYKQIWQNLTLKKVINKTSDFHSNTTSLFCIQIWHSEDRISWYIIIIKPTTNTDF